MRKFLTALALVLLFTAHARALDLALNDGSVYHDIRLRSMSERGITVEYDKGFAGVDYLKMSEADRLTFGYRKVKYDAAIAREKADAETARQRAAEKASGDKAAAAAQASVKNSGASGTASSSVSSAISSGQCSATTKKGARCKRNASPGSSYCWQHGG